MEAFLEKGIEGLNLDRSEWQLVKFGDVAIQQKQTVDRESTGLTRYVKGEHMYSEDLHLREWGELKDEYLGPAFIRYFSQELLCCAMGTKVMAINVVTGGDWKYTCCNTE